MKPANAQVCISCEEMFIGDECPKCGSRHYFYLRQYFPLMFKFGGDNETVTLKQSPEPDPLQVELEAELCHHSIGCISPDTYDPNQGRLITEDASTTHSSPVDQGGRKETGVVSRFSGLDRTSRVLGEAICRLLEICRGLNASSPPHMETQVDEVRASRAGKKFNGGYEHSKNVHERELNLE